MADYYLGAGDALPEFLHQLILPNGAPENLTGKTVQLLLRKVNRRTGATEMIIAAGAAVPSTVDDEGNTVTPVSGWAKYALTSEQAAQIVVSNLHTYDLRWRVITDGRPMSFPNDRWLSLAVS